MKIFRAFVVFFATGIYTGYAPIASGTFGTLIGILCYSALFTATPLVYGIVLALGTLFSFWIAEEAQKIFQEQDSGKIVIDEVIGFLYTMFLIPLPPFDHSHAFWKHFIILIILGFLLFRILDILKPFPARLIDNKVHSGVGVVLDDVFAGIYANLLLRLILHFHFSIL